MDAAGDGYGLWHLIGCKQLCWYGCGGSEHRRNDSTIHRAAGLDLEVEPFQHDDQRGANFDDRQWCTDTHSGTGTEGQVCVGRGRDAFPAFGQESIGLFVQISSVMSDELTEDDGCTGSQLQWSQRDSGGSDSLGVGRGGQDAHAFANDGIEVFELFEFFECGNISGDLSLQFVGESGQHIGVLSEQKQGPAERVGGGEVSGCEEQCGVSGELIVGHAATGFGGLHQQVQDIETIGAAVAVPCEHIADGGFEFFGLLKEQFVAAGKLRGRHEGSHPDFVIAVRPAIDEESESFGEGGVIESKQEGAGHAEHELDHFAVEVNLRFTAPAAGEFVGESADDAVVAGECFFGEDILEESAGIAVLCSILAEQSRGDSPLR